MSIQKLSEYYLPTRKEDPTDAEIASHKLMIRAGMIRKLTQGIYTHLPLGQRVLQNIENIVRAEMNEAGANEILMPVVQPRELWEKTDRWDEYGPEMMKLTDRHDREYGLGPTHEEVITDLVTNEIVSYRDTPVTLYQIATKFRDEIRPRFGVMRCREFIMKDAYSFDASEESAKQTYERMDEAYQNIFDRIGFEYRKVEAATGAIGGSLSHEFMVLASNGEDQILYCENCEYAANQEQARSEAPDPNSDITPPQKTLEKFETPGVSTIEELMEIDSDARPEYQIKTLVFRINGQTTLLLVPGDYELNENKLQTQTDSPVEKMTDAEIHAELGAHPGSLGALNIDDCIKVWADPSLQDRTHLYTGANEDGFHFRGVSMDRDIDVDRWVDLRSAQPGDLCVDCNTQLQSRSGIEVGHIFYLGTKYSEALNATIQAENGSKSPLIMGCYGIGITRIAAAVIEQNHDENGIIWPPSIAPFQVYILVINWDDDERRQVAQTLAGQLDELNVDVLIDDRDESAGVKFNESELIGIPYRLTIGRSLDDGNVEFTVRETGESDDIPIDSCVEHLKQELGING